MASGGVLLRPLCGYIDPLTEAQCRRPAVYEFELDPRSWPEARPPIIQWACDTHGRDARTMPGVIRMTTII